MKANAKFSSRKGAKAAKEISPSRTFAPLRDALHLKNNLPNLVRQRNIAKGFSDPGERAN